jgi:hypothetical protein
MTKQSRLAKEKSPVRLSKQDGRFYHLKAGKKRPRDGHSKARQSGFRMSTVNILIYDISLVGHSRKLIEKTFA